MDNIQNRKTNLSESDESGRAIKETIETWKNHQCERTDYLLLCNAIWYGTQHIEHINETELNALFEILGGGQFAQRFLATKGGVFNRPNQKIQKLLSQKQKHNAKHHPMSCEEIKQLHKQGINLFCNPSCGEKSPFDLKNKEFHWHKGPFGEKVNGFECNKNGIYYTQNASSKKKLLLPRPVWISKHNGNGTIIISFVNMVGSQQEIAINEPCLDSPIVFKRLEHSGLPIPAAPKRRNAIRCYLKSQYQRCKEYSNFTFISNGWHKINDDKYYIFKCNTYPKSENKVLSAINRDAPILKNKYCKTYQNRLSDLLITCLEIMALYLEPLKFYQGICLHFYYPNINQTGTILPMENALQSGYDTSKSISLLAEISEQHQDGTVRFISADNDTSLLRLIIRRYLVGRKNGNNPTRGAVLSEGKSSLVESFGSIQEYHYNKKLIAVCIAMDTTARQQFPFSINQNYIDKSITALSKDITKATEFVKHHYKQYLKNLKKQNAIWGKDIEAFFALLSSIAHWARRNGIIMWSGSDGPGDVILRYFTGWHNVDSIFYKNLEVIVEKSLMHTLEQHNQSFYKVFHKNDHIIFITPATMKSLLPTSSMRNLFIAWIKKNKILIHDTEKQNTVVRYIQDVNKSLRGYLININTAKNFLSHPTLSGYEYCHPIFRPPI